MPSPDIKKLHERFMLERFIDAAGMSLDILEEREAPDFIVRVEDKVVGIEVTRLFISNDRNGSSLQAQESISAGIVARARKLYESGGGPPAHVSVHFAYRDLRGIDRDYLASSLAAFVLNLDLVPWRRSDWSWGDGDKILDEHVSFLHALGVPEHKMAHWAVPRAGWVAPVTPEALQALIDKKAPRLASYQATVRENWLLIVADGTKPSQLFEVRDDFDGSKTSSPFARTFFYVHPERAIIELGA